MKEQSEMLAKVNYAIHAIAEKSNSDLFRRLRAVQSYGNHADYLFSSTVDVWSNFDVSGAEVSILSEEQLQTCVLCRIIGTMYKMVSLLQDQIEKLEGTRRWNG